ncbi:MAG TPA: Rv3235 family protein [Nocardioidaceae bacterium]|nr:Rv3235 family protein [Nocardioidaceae bacterium]
MNSNQAASGQPSSTSPARGTVPEPPWASVTPVPVPVASVQGTLALDLAGAPPLPQTPELRVVGTGTAPAGGEGADGCPTGGAAGADVTAWSGRFAQAVVEVLGGDRPLSQLVRWTSTRVYADLDRRVRILGRTTGAGQRARTVRPQVRSVHVFQPSADAAEVSVHVRHGRRSRALAARLELRRGRWQCTALQLG